MSCVLCACDATCKHPETLQDLFELIPCQFAGSYSKRGKGCTWHSHRLKAVNWKVPPFALSETEEVATHAPEGVELIPKYGSKEWTLPEDDEDMAEKPKEDHETIEAYRARVQKAVGLMLQGHNEESDFE